jgi:hypothetical protein
LPSLYILVVDSPSSVFFVLTFLHRTSSASANAQHKDIKESSWCQNWLTGNQILQWLPSHRYCSYD